MIYFARCGHDGPIKIGHTIGSVDARISYLQVGCPWKISVLATIEGDLDDEAFLLKKFAHLNIRGEWFHAADELISFIDHHVSLPVVEKSNSCAIPLLECEFDVKKLREDLRMTQAQLAATVNVDQSTVSLWETDKITPRGPARMVLAGLAIKAERQKRRLSAETAP